MSKQVDSSRRITPKRVIARRGKMTVRHTDHFSLEIKLKMPEKAEEKKNKTLWNLKKPGGWETYEKLTDDIAVDLEQIIEDEDKDIDTVLRRIDELQEKVKFKSFGKSKVNVNKVRELIKPNDKTEEDEAIDLMRKQSEKIEDEIKKVISSTPAPRKEARRPRQ